MSLTLLGHGSPDPRHARAVAALADRLTRAGSPACVAYLDHDRPSPADTARALHHAGVTRTTLVPLLISPAYHARVDVPAAVAAMRSAAPGLEVAAAEPVGLHPLLIAGAAELVQASGMPMGPRTGLILAAAGSRDLRAVAAIETLVRRHGHDLAAQLGIRAVRAAYLDGGRPLGGIHTLLRCVDGARDCAVVTLMIADGLLRDRIVTAAERHELPVVPGTLSDTGALADLVALRAGAAPVPAPIPDVRATVGVAG